jgi:hypothetical protein
MIGFPFAPDARNRQNSRKTAPAGEFVQLGQQSHKIKPPAMHE